MTATTFRRTAGDRGFDLVVHTIVVAAFVVTLYPFLYVVSMSLSETGAVLRDEVWLFPKGLEIDAYRTVLKDDRIWRSYYNTIWYTSVGTLFNLVFTVMAAYPLSKRKFFARNFFMVAIVVTFLFQGGIIPTFIIVARLGLYGSRWALVFPALISVYYLIICRTFFQQLPEDLFENARLEGAEEWRIVWKIVLPLSQPIVAVLALFYGIQPLEQLLPGAPVSAGCRFASDPDLPAAGGGHVAAGDAAAACGYRRLRRGCAGHAQGQVRGDRRCHRADRHAVPVPAALLREGRHDRRTQGMTDRYAPGCADRSKFR